MKQLIHVIYQYKFDLILQKLLLFFLKRKPLGDIIIIESHNDFDSNGGAFYDYLIKNGYNKKYKIVWLVKNCLPKELPENVKAYSLFTPSLKKNYYICRAKYLTADCEVTGKVRNEQVSLYLTHGAFSLKNSHGRINIPESVDYILIPSEYTRGFQEKQYNPFSSTKMVVLGFPVHDMLFSELANEIQKITSKEHRKVIIWMPTFRKGGGYNRNDSNIELPLGIPVLENEKQYDELNKYLKQLDILLIIKMHPMQEKSSIKISDKSNILVLRGEDVKRLGINTYQLLKETDALISDYSSISFDYLLLNKPIAYVFSDLAEYKNGLISDAPEELMAGFIINNFMELLDFIDGISSSTDEYNEKRAELRNRIFEFCDGNSAKRLVDFLDL
ncbi:CDP-glycerol glycerophosphotransferase family protein [Gorillibacterium timonense]|uniref:CDP-glycerol glycerophosphotransferase family protein n=1 Tax=Gorillibacterium timonense TaxID=1689269 RepID=UPI0018FEB615|nr:CDP-glycerol glycerophosphotransferase family protein [Gorillibacterium timonense]